MELFISCSINIIVSSLNSFFNRQMIDRPCLFDANKLLPGDFKCFSEFQ